MGEAERKRLEEIRQLKEVHETEMKDVKKIAKTEILKLMDEVRSKDRSIIELQTQLKKISESEHKSLLKEEASRDKWLNAKERRQANRIASLQEKIGQVQEAASLREQNLSQEIRRGREEKEREVN